ncbi:uncharacterized protein V1513DRAFT_438515 [Lipomyces chichibuensis]|uniref:uncharacterized protein n=1 Tax=Lipomyces chichibuensis TaxID=1546026 RepID=UPI0033440C43
MDLKAIVSPESTPHHDAVSHGSLSDRSIFHPANELPATITCSPSPLSPTGSSALPSPKLSPLLEEFPVYTTKPDFNKRSLSAPSLSSRSHDGRIDTHSTRSSQVPSSTKSPGSNRRFAHILSEQRRRENINGGFLELKGSIPQCQGTQDSKAVILQKAVLYISSLESELTRVKSELYACQQQRAAPQPMVPQRQQQQQPTTPVQSDLDLSVPPPAPAPAPAPPRVLPPSLPPPPPPQMYVHASPPVASLPPPSPLTTLSHPVAYPYMPPGQYYTSYPAQHHLYAVPMPPRMTAAWKVPSAV